MILVDSSALINFLRGIDSPAAERLADLERVEMPFTLPGICYQEVLQGAKDEREWDLLSEYLETQYLLVPHDPLITHREAARIFFDCRRKGISIHSLADCFIAQLALENDGLLLHDDEGFERIKRVRPLRTLQS